MEQTRYLYWKIERAVSPWQLITDSPTERKKAIENGAMFFTWAALSAPYKGNGQPEPVRYGNFPLDFDSAEDPGLAWEQAGVLCLIHLPELYDLDPYAIKHYLSGGKGLHATIPAALFNAQAGDPYLPLIYKRISLRWKEQFSLTTLDTSLYCMGKGKMFRIQNVKRSNGNYKVPLALEEVRELPPEKLFELSTAPREVEPVGVDLSPNSELAALYESCRKEVYAEIKKQKSAASGPPSAKKLPKDLPPCIDYILTEHPKTDKTTFNKLTMDVISYLQGAGYTKDEAASSVDAFISGYPHSSEYTTPEARAKHFDAQWEYLSNNPNYSFDCSYILGKGFPGSAFDCGRCDIKEKRKANVDEDQKERKTISEDALEFPNYVMSGAAAYFADVYSEVMEAPVQFLYMSYLTCLGSFLSPKLSIDSVLETQPRFFTLLLGRSNVERKSTTIKKVTALFKNLTHGFKYHHGVGSDMGLAKLLNKLDDFDNEALGTLLIFDEFKSFVNKCKIQAQVLLQCVNTLFENNEFENATKKSHVVIENAHLSILAATTIQTYARIYTPEFIDIGFPNRVFIVPGSTQRQFAIPKPISANDAAQLEEHLKNIILHVGGGLTLTVSEDAHEYYKNWYFKLPDSIYADRMETYSLRCAIILAVNDLKPQIDLETMKKATALCDWQIEVRREFDPIQAEDRVTEMEERIRRVLQKESLTESKIKQKINPWKSENKPISLWVYSKALKNLKDAKEIAQNKETKLWHLMENE
jgi:hypothetical protein